MKNPIKVGLKEIPFWHDDFEAEIRAYEDEHADKGQIVFYGPSNFTRWSARYGNVPLREALPGRSGRLCALNRGFGSSCPEHHLYFYSRLIRAAEPSALVYSTGLGNGMFFGYTPEELFELAQRVVLYALSDFPELRVYLLGENLNRSDKPYEVEFNGWLREFAAGTPGCTYLDITANVLLSRKDIYVADNVHYNNEGYRLYADFFREALRDEFDRF